MQEHIIACITQAVQKKDRGAVPAGEETAKQGQAIPWRKGELPELQRCLLHPAEPPRGMGEAKGQTDRVPHDPDQQDYDPVGRMT